jgi:hypothetical protein
MVKNFDDLSEAEIVTLAISNKETDARIYGRLCGPARVRGHSKEGIAFISSVALQNPTHAQWLSVGGARYGGV